MGRQTRGRRIARVAALAVLTLGAWGALVVAAIDLGRQARSSGGWTLFWLAAAGAVACLAMTVLLGARLVGLVRGTAPERPERVPGRRVAR